MVLLDRQCVNLVSCSVTAAITLGWRWPVFKTAIPPAEIDKLVAFAPKLAFSAFFRIPLTHHAYTTWSCLLFTCVKQNVDYPFDSLIFSSSVAALVLHPVLNFQGALQRLPMHVISLV